MKKIKLKNFGKVLTSRSDGKTAFATVLTILDPDEDKIEIDFSDITALSHGWADEFFSSLKDMYGQDNIVYLPTDNKSVKETLKFLEEVK